MADKPKILDQLKSEIKKSMLARDQKKTAALKYIASLIEKELTRKGSLSQEEGLVVLQKEMKSKKEALTLFKKGGRDELVKQEQEEIKYLEEFLPEQMSEDDIRVEIKKIVSEEGDNFGKIMGMAMAKLKGKAPGNLVSKIVKEEIGN